MAALPGGAGGAVCGSGAEASDPPDRGVVLLHARPRPLHPRHRQGHLADRRAGRLLHLRLPRYPHHHLISTIAVMML